jgi:Flp pilus assembly protein TadG
MAIRRNVGDKLLRSRQGAAAVELAIVSPFLCFLFVISVDYARVFYYGMTLENAARSGAYYASNYPGIYGYTSAQQTSLGDTTNLSPAPTVSVLYSYSASGPYTSSTPISNGYVQVKVNWTFRTVTTYPGIPKETMLSRTCRMKVAPITPTFSN